MNNLFKTKCFVLVILAGALLTGCSSDDMEPAKDPSTDKPVVSNSYYMSVNASKGEDEETATGAKNSPRHALSLDENQNRLISTWAKTEYVYVKYDNQWFEGSLQPDRNGGTAWLNGTISGIEFQVPEGFMLQFPRKEINYTGQKGTIEDIAARYDYAKATPHVDKIEDHNIKATASVTFDNLQAIVRFTLKDQDGNDLNVKSLLISATGLKKTDTEQGDIEITPATPTNVIFAALSGVDGNITLTAVTNDGKTYVYSKTGITFANGQYRHITVKMRSVTNPEAINLSEVTTSHIGWVVGQNRMVFANAQAASSAGTTAAAMIAYVSETGKGLAIALNDENDEMNLTAAQTAASGKTPAIEGCTWKLPLKTEWDNMADIQQGCGGFATINSKLETAGGTKMNGTYWASVNYDNITFDADGAKYGTGFDLVSYKVRACLVFQ